MKRPQGSGGGKPTPPLVSRQMGCMFVAVYPNPDDALCTLCGYLLLDASQPYTCNVALHTVLATVPSSLEVTARTARPMSTVHVPPAARTLALFRKDCARRASQAL